MDQTDRQRIQVFIDKWQDSEGNERANYQGLFLDLCTALAVDSPPPRGSVEGAPHCFDKDIKFFSGEKSESTRFADVYKQGCFLIEAKQGSESSGEGHGKRGTKAYRDNLQEVFNQAKAYVYNRLLGSRPPFLITCNIGSYFEIWAGFGGEYGSYEARHRVNLTDLKQRLVFDRFVKNFEDPQVLNPETYRARVTREAAAELAKLSPRLEENAPHPNYLSPGSGTSSQTSPSAGVETVIRPPYSSGRGAGDEDQQGTLESITPQELVVEPVEQQKWPPLPKAQLAAIHNLFRAPSGDWTAKQIAAQFKGRTTQKRLFAITETLERLEWFGPVILEHRDSLNYWHFAESARQLKAVCSRFIQQQLHRI